MTTTGGKNKSLQRQPVRKAPRTSTEVPLPPVDTAGNSQSENVIPHNNSLWDTVFNSVGDAIAIINVDDFTIVEVNRRFLEEYGLSRDQVIGKTCHAITHHETAPCAGPEHSCPLIAAVGSGQIAAIEHIHYNKAGKRIAFEVSAAPVRDENGKIVQVVHVARDVTERKMAQQQLIINDRLASIGMLASGIAHEVGNPLTAIMGYANTLPLMAELPVDIKDGLAVIQAESQRAADILKNLLTFARPESGKKLPVDINEGLSRVLSLRSYYQKTNNINTYLSLAPDLPAVSGNRSQLEQVFYNLIANAEFSMVEAHQGGNLAIVTEGDDKIVRIKFTDDGGGIAESNLYRIFTPFFTTKKVGQGTGLGLSICLSIVTEHGGRMWAESTKGKGAAFTIELPSTQTK